MSGTLSENYSSLAAHLRLAEEANESEFGATDSLLKPDPKVSKSGQQTQSQSNIIILLQLQTLERLRSLDQRLSNLENGSSSGAQPLDIDGLISRFAAMVPDKVQPKKPYTRRVNVGNIFPPKDPRGKEKE